MKYLTLDEVKDVELGILKYIWGICKDNNITMYLGAGTLLGAVRHKGFIPWDDDIDVMMPRADYTKLLEIMKQQPSERYLPLTPKSKTYPYSYTKVVDLSTRIIEKEIADFENMGIWVDVFPLDGFPTDKPTLHKKIGYFMNKCRAAATYGVCPEKYANWRLRWRLCRMVGANFFKNIVIKLSVKYDFYQSAFVGHYPSSINLVHTKEMFADSVEVEFEGDKYLAPIGYKQYLTQLYGDYMQMPPEDKRITHCVKAILKD